MGNYGSTITTVGGLVELTDDFSAAVAIEINNCETPEIGTINFVQKPSRGMNKKDRIMFEGRTAMFEGTQLQGLCTDTTSDPLCQRCLAFGFDPEEPADWGLMTVVYTVKNPQSELFGETGRLGICFQDNGEGANADFEDKFSIQFLDGAYGNLGTFDGDLSGNIQSVDCN